jgi:hypothetical protein
LPQRRELAVCAGNSSRFATARTSPISLDGISESKGLIGPGGCGLTMSIFGLPALLLAALDHRSAVQTLNAQYPITAQYAKTSRLQGEIARRIGRTDELGVLSVCDQRGVTQPVLPQPQAGCLVRALADECNRSIRISGNVPTPVG